MIEKIAKAIAKKAHRGDTDRAGVDYFGGHLTTVAGGLKGDKEKAVGWLHDVIEDTPMTAKTLLDALVAGGADPKDAKDVVDAVVSVTKVDGESYDAYLRRVKGNKIGRKVKISDLTHNMDMSRLGGKVGAADIERNAKYAKARKFLK